MLPVLMKNAFMKTSLATFIICSSIIFSVVACSSDEIGNSKDVNPETVYMDYAVNYSQGDDSVNCLLQYRFAGEDGTTLVLSHPSNVAIDGKEIPVDSAAFSGAYYEKKFAAKHFDGEHTIAFTDVNGTIHQEQFNFSHISCSDQIPASIGKEDWVIPFEGVSPGDVINVNISDTASATEDISINSEPGSNKLTVTGQQLEQLRNGPLQVKIYKSQLIPLLQPTKEGGKFIINYDIKQASIQLQ